MKNSQITAPVMHIYRYMYNLYVQMTCQLVMINLCRLYYCCNQNYLTGSYSHCFILCTSYTIKFENFNKKYLIPFLSLFHKLLFLLLAWWWKLQRSLQRYHGRNTCGVSWSLSCVLDDNKYMFNVTCLICEPITILLVRIGHTHLIFVDGTCCRKSIRSHLKQ